MRKILSLCLSVLMLLMLAAAASGTETLQQQIAGLPSVEEFKALSQEEQVRAYERTQQVYDAYMALPSDAERAALTGAQEKFEALFTYFNGQIMPIEIGDTPETTETPEPPEESSEETPDHRLLWAIPAAAGILLLFRLRKKRT